MSITGYKRVTALLAFTTLLAIALLVTSLFAVRTQWDTYKDLRSTMNLLQEFDRMRSCATNSDIGIVIASLENLDYLDLSRAQYHRSTPYDDFVERERRRAIGEVIGILRAKTGQDLGDDPRKWIEKYAK